MFVFYLWLPQICTPPLWGTLTHTSTVGHTHTHTSTVGRKICLGGLWKCTVLDSSFTVFCCPLTLFNSARSCSCSKTTSTGPVPMSAHPVDPSSTHSALDSRETPSLQIVLVSADSAGDGRGYSLGRNGGVCVVAVATQSLGKRNHFMVISSWSRNRAWSPKEQGLVAPAANVASAIDNISCTSATALALALALALP